MLNYPSDCSNEWKVPSSLGIHTFAVQARTQTCFLDAYYNFTISSRAHASMGLLSILVRELSINKASTSKVIFSKKLIVLLISRRYLLKNLFSSFIVINSQETFRRICVELIQLVKIIFNKKLALGLWSCKCVVRCLSWSNWSPNILTTITLGGVRIFCPYEYNSLCLASFSVDLVSYL